MRLHLCQILQPKVNLQSACSPCPAADHTSLALYKRTSTNNDSTQAQTMCDLKLACKLKSWQWLQSPHGIQSFASGVCYLLLHSLVQDGFGPPSSLFCFHRGFEADSCRLPAGLAPVWDQLGGNRCSADGASTASYRASARCSHHSSFQSSCCRCGVQVLGSCWPASPSQGTACNEWPDNASSTDLPVLQL